MSLRARIAAATVVTALGAVVLVAVVGTALAGSFLRGAAVADLERQAAAAGDTIAAISSQSRRRPSADLPRAAQILERALDRLAIDGAVVDVDTPRGPAAELLSTEERRRLGAGLPVQGSASVGGREVAFAAQPGDPPVIVWRPIASLADSAREVGRRLLTAGLLGTAVAAVVGWVVGDRLSRPVRRLEATVASVGAGDLARRVPAAISRRQDEIGALGRGIDGMADALARSREEQRTFFRSVAHELRTPLTNVQGYAEGLLDGAFDEAGQRNAAAVIREESIRLARLVGDVMTLARLDTGDFEVDVSTGDVAEIVRATVTAATPTAREAEVALIEDAASAVVETDPDRVRQILDNLVANALRVTPAGGAVVVRARGSRDGGATIEVEDSGPGIDQDDVPHAFERYHLWRRYRGQREVGTGLGLAIVAGLVERLGGRVAVDGGGNGRGATFTVDLPARPLRAAPPRREPSTRGPYDAAHADPGMP